MAKVQARLTGVNALRILKNIVVLMLALVVVTGCKSKNPLVGKWTVDLNSLSGDTRMVVENSSENRSIEFTDDKMIFTNEALLVSYEINGKLVKVRPAGNNVDPVVIIMKDDGSILVPTPKAGTIRYVRAVDYEVKDERSLK